MYFDETIGCATSSIDQLRDGRYLYAITKAAAIECPYGVFSSKFWSRRFERVKEYIPGLQDSLPFVCGLVGYSFQGERERERESQSYGTIDMRFMLYVCGSIPFLWSRTIIQRIASFMSHPWASPTRS